jgi:hypothetical protein
LKLLSITLAPPATKSYTHEVHMHASSYTKTGKSASRNEFQ